MSGGHEFHLPAYASAALFSAASGLAEVGTGGRFGSCSAEQHELESLIQYLLYFRSCSTALNVFDGSRV